MPVFTTAPASLRIRRAARSTSTASITPSPGTTPPSATTNPNTKPEPADATTPPTATPTSPLLENEGFMSKAKRAYERDRQRTKRRKERADRQLERERERTAAAESHAECRHCRDGAGRAAGRAVAKPRGGGVVVSEDDEDAYDGVGPLSPQLEEIIADIVQREAHAKGSLSTPAVGNGAVEVHLDELVRPARPRKSKAGEFELVPGVPVVIALDDHMADDAELDEAWEHISADELDEKRVVPPSYATIVANAA